MPYHHYTPPEAVSLVTPDRITGQERRFVCICGMRTLDTVEAIMHAFDELIDPKKHRIHEERFSLGMWHYDRASVATKMLEKMRKKGETVNDFAKRITAQLNAVTAQMEQYEAKGGKW